MEPDSGPGFVTDSTQAIGALAEFDLDAPLVEGLSAGAQAAIDALPPTSALLVVLRGPNVGSRFLLDADSTSAGRSTRSDIFLDDVTVSRRHATFDRDGASFMVRDLGSLNGTYVNRERVDRALLKAGDEVQIGKYRLTFRPSPSRPA
ncbi:MAG: FHA domain-containing protein [Bifidobacteriaceae bacterium]|nr:FHA domain-containing protein [Bifidobacteriaceae bacterium]